MRDAWAWGAGGGRRVKAVAHALAERRVSCVGVERYAQLQLAARVSYGLHSCGGGVTVVTWSDVCLRRPGTGRASSAPASVVRHARRALR